MRIATLTPSTNWSTSNHDADLKAVNLPAWLVSSFGKQRAAHLLRALSRHPCMGCRSGLIACEDCETKGFFADGRVCDACSGLGATNCGFCSGSGWITYNFLPVGLRSIVALERTKQTISATRGLLSKPVPPVDASNLADCRKTLAKQLLRFNRFCGVLNNALSVARHPSLGDAHAATVLPKVEAACLAEAEKLKHRMRALLLASAQIAQAEIPTARNEAERDLARRRSEFYTQLASSTDFSGTSLFHVHLSDSETRSDDESNL